MYQSFKDNTMKYILNLYGKLNTFFGIQGSYTAQLLLYGMLFLILITFSLFY
ncbi:hypothetical protein COM24_20585 [Bacillus toyonensis]|uniref:Uncharacterized protein n=1 Tax=Bacillus toyonensis TaxID=155322 RepID=A0A2C5M5E1_9BACI|nr:hypothetical protein Btoyo_3420 [Bacillus toyonensis BCT-7112]ARC29794.1 hypothetical protein A6J74_13140 [Bacillus sp. FDAARGOS_235]KAB0449520.1 hypothetical protein CH334_03515 [Lysinibacillus sp. VIA-II-2016]KMP61113.1 hypothetical protein TU60_03720 [Bacillus toyonensis]KNH40732.1 hypothetical protein ACS75_09650 [Bacillus thuringiensis]KXY21254.1 hypothetical protein AT259_00085 [Bacillus cereus]MBH0357394.1 hypothetical protein [Bacillus toyonensis biovar Thuringiensis]